MVDKQPKLTDPGVADIPVEDDYDQDVLKIDQVREKPSYVTRAVAARQRAGLNSKPEPRASQGVGDERADDVVVIDDDDDTAQGFIEAPPLTIKIEPEDIPVESEPEPEELGRGRRKKIQRVLF